MLFIEFIKLILEIITSVKVLHLINFIFICEIYFYYFFSKEKNKYIGVIITVILIYNGPITL